MNIKDVETEVPVKGSDMLECIFARQLELMEKYQEIEKASGLLQTEMIPVDIHSKEGQARLKDFAWRVTEELGEAMNTLKNKPWKQTHMVTDVNHYMEEISDAFHFFIELCVLSGLGPKELYDLYFRKSEVNRFRQGSKY